MYCVGFSYDVIPLPPIPHVPIPTYDKGRINTRLFYEKKGYKKMRLKWSKS